MTKQPTSGFESKDRAALDSCSCGSINPLSKFYKADYHSNWQFELRGMV
jgi:hypothetical protein